AISVGAVNKIFRLQDGLSMAAVGSTAPDGTESLYPGDREVITKPDGTRTVKMSDGTTYSYKVKISRERNRTFGGRVDDKTVVTLPGSHPIEVEEDGQDRAFFGQKSNLAASLSVELVRQAASAVNVIGVLPGNDPQLKNEAIIVGAHYDHLGHG